MIRRLLALTALSVLLLSPAAEALAGALSPHRAVYEMTLLKTRTGSGIAGVRGEMAVQYQRDCQGWTFEHRSVLEVSFVETGSIRLSTRATSWESVDGTEYVFALRHASDGTETERIEGRARVSEGEEGIAEFTAPEAQRFVLPRGTLFPVAHSDAVLAAAARAGGPVTLSRHVFDGMGVEGPFEVNAVVRPAGPPAEPNPAAASLAGLDAWRLNLAYFQLAAPEALPKHEIAMRLYVNGVADELQIDFSDFTVHAALEKIDLLDAPVCRD